MIKNELTNNSKGTPKTALGTCRIGRRTKLVGETVSKVPYSITWYTRPYCERHNPEGLADRQQNKDGNEKKCSFMTLKVNRFFLNQLLV